MDELEEQPFLDARLVQLVFVLSALLCVAFGEPRAAGALLGYVLAWRVRAFQHVLHACAVIAEYRREKLAQKLRECMRKELKRALVEVRKELAGVSPGAVIIVRPEPQCLDVVRETVKDSYGNTHAIEWDCEHDLEAKGLRSQVAGLIRERNEARGERDVAEHKLREYGAIDQGLRALAQAGVTAEEMIRGLAQLVHKPWSPCSVCLVAERMDGTNVYHCTGKPGCDPPPAVREFLTDLQKSRQ